MRFITAGNSLLVLWALMGAACTTQNSTVEFNRSAEWDTAKRADVHAQLAAQYMNRDRLNVALEEIKSALAIDPNHSRSNYVMAVLQTRLNEPELANNYYLRALKSEPKNAEAAHDYGIFLCNRDNVEQAMKYFEQALSNPLYTGFVISNVRAGECLATMGKDPDEAEKYFKAALQANPRVPTALYYMASTSFTRQSYLSARGYIERFFSISPETPQSLMLAAQIEKQLKSFDMAEDYVRRLNAKFPSSAEAKQLRGM